MTKYTCTPPILPAEVMSPETEQLCWKFMEAHPIPACLQVSAFPLGGYSYGLGDPTVYTPSSSLRQTLPLSKISPLKNEDLLMKIFASVLKENLITQFMKDCDDNREDFLVRHGYLHVLVMPGVVRVCYPRPESLARRWVKRLNEPDCSTSPSQLTGMNLGTFAAGPYSSSHEKIEAQARVEKMRPLWEPLHKGFYDRNLLQDVDFKMTDPVVADGSNIQEIRNG